MTLPRVDEDPIDVRKTVDFTGAGSDKLRIRLVFDKELNNLPLLEWELVVRRELELAIQDAVIIERDRRGA